MTEKVTCLIGKCTTVSLEKVEFSIRQVTFSFDFTVAFYQKPD